MNWVLAGSCSICLPVLFFVKVNYKRLDIDETTPCGSMEVLENIVAKKNLHDLELSNNFMMSELKTNL